MKSNSVQFVGCNRALLATRPELGRLCVCVCVRDHVGCFVTENRKGRRQVSKTLPQMALSISLLFLETHLALSPAPGQTNLSHTLCVKYWRHENASVADLLSFKWKSNLRFLTGVLFLIHDALKCKFALVALSLAINFCGSSWLLIEFEIGHSLK